MNRPAPTTPRWPLVRGLRRARIQGVALLAAAAVTVLPAAAHGGDGEHSLVDPLRDGQPPPSTSDLAGSVRTLETARVRSLEPQVRELRTEERAGDQTTVTISADVLFSFDSAELNEAAVRIVMDLVERIARAGSDVAVVGHTDAVGSREYNQQLSEQRAEAVAALLRDGLDGSRTVTTEGRNFSEPVAPEQVDGQDSPEGRARNRRVEIIFEEP